MEFGTELEEISHWDPVINVQTSSSSYSMWTNSGMRMDIVKVQNMQLPVENPNLYTGHLWVKSVQGYFILRQVFQDQKPGDWVLVREIVPANPGRYFFEEFGDTLEQYIAELEANLEPPPASD